MSRSMSDGLTRPSLAEIEALARHAGAILRDGFARRPGSMRDLDVQYKSHIEPVTEMDHRSEEYLLGEIARRFPGHSVMSEESGELSGDERALWIIDPLDGTVNYAHGVPLFSVSIGFLWEGELALGVVYDPMQDECFSGEKGRGAFLNGGPIRVSSADALNRSLLTTGFAYDVHTRADTNLDLYASFTLLTQGVRRTGSAALDTCYTAAGRFDGYWERAVMPWDVAAGMVIAREAGARVTNLTGDDNVLRQPCSILAANPAIYSLMFQVIHPQA